MPDLWQEDTQACIDAKVLSPESRSDISRTLVTLVTAKYGPNPGKTKFDEVARKLILKYPFMKDDMGSGYVSRTYIYIHMHAIMLIYFIHCSHHGRPECWEPCVTV